MTKQRALALILVLAGVLIGVASWWFEIEKPARDAAKKAAQEANSKAQYWTQLRLVRHIKQPFRLLFDAYDGDPNKPESLAFQINTIDVRQPTQFVKIGEIIAGTEFKVMKFQLKRNFSGDEDRSELTLQNTGTAENVVLALGGIVDVPDSYALFRYQWNKTEFAVKKNGEFVLLPDVNARYRLIDVTDSEAVIVTPGGQEVNVPHL